MIHLVLSTVDEVLGVGERLARGGDGTGDRPVGTTGGSGAVSLVAAADLVAADRRREDRDRRRTLAGRLALRLLACAVEGRPASEAASLVVDRTCDECGEPHGRPRLSGRSASTSTSGDLVAVAVADESLSVGVDVQEHPEALWAGFDDYALHPGERAAVPSGPDGLAHRVQLWTDKEALLKSVGTGLRSDPSGFRVAATASGGLVSAAAGADWRPLAQVDDPRLSTGWVATVDVGRGAAASVAAARPTPIRAWTMSGQRGESVEGALAVPRPVRPG